MAGEKYQGWTNRETWAVALWIDNDREAYESWMTEARELADRAAGGGLPARCELADRMEATFDDDAESISDRLTDGPWIDLINTALNRVSFHELADHYLGKVAEERAAR
jgi:hypothetical protein